MLEQTAQKSLLDKANEIPDMTERMGQFIDNEIIMSRNVTVGGCTVEILGSQGTGKTSLMLNYAMRVMQTNPEEIVIWRDSYQSPVQFNRLSRWEIFAERGVELKIKDINANKIVDLPVTIFNDFAELNELMKPKQLNVVYVRDQVIGYIKLINFFKSIRGWQSIFLDEYEDVAPINASGVKYTLVGALGNEMKNLRKGLISLFCDTQSKSQIDWRVRDTFMVEAYLSGAKKNKGSSVYQEAINSLEKGVAWLSWEGKFGRINFPAVIPRNPIYVIDDVNRISDLDRAIAELDSKKTI
jgi:hypothetical protein